MGDGATGFQTEQLLQHAAWVRRVAAHLVVDAARADDVAQQTLLAALTQPPKRTDSPRAWLASVARSLARRAARSDERRERHEAAAPPAGPSPSVHEVVARAETQRALVDAVLALDEPYRTALLLRFFENRSPRAIAKETNAPVETVRTRLKRGLELLRARYVERRAQNWAIGLVSLIEPRHWSGLRSLVAAKSAAASASVAGGLSLTGGVGVLAMTAKWKLIAAAVVLAAGTFTAVEVCRSPSPPAAIAAASTPSQRGPTNSHADLPATPLADAARTEVPPASAPAAERTIVPPTLAALEGRVVDADGEPVENAVVLAERVEHGKARFSTIFDLVREFEGLAHQADVDAKHGEVRRAIADADGAFRFDGFAPGSDLNIAAVERTRGLALSIGVALEGAGSTKEVELELLDGVVLHGTVRDPAGNPVSGAIVMINTYAKTGVATDADRLKGIGNAFVFAMCGSDGTYRTLAVPYREFSFSFEAKGYVSHRPRTPGTGGNLVVAAGVHDHQEDCTLELAPRLRGTIVNLDGSPARLAATDRALEIVGSLRPPEEMSALALGTRGNIDLAYDRYEFACESGRPSYLSIWSDGLLLGWATVPPEGDAPELRIDLARLVPESAASLTLEVVDGATGRPIPEFTAAISFDALASDSEGVPDPEPRVVHDESGRVRFDALNPGIYVLTVRAPEFASRCMFAASQTSLDAPARRVELRRAKASISGRVVDRDGAAVVGADLCLRAPDGGLALALPECLSTSNGSGAFRFDGVPEGDWFVVADHSGFAPIAMHARDGDANVFLTLESGVLVGITLSSDKEDETHVPNWCRIFDEHGIPVVDLHRPGRFIVRLGSGMAQRLAEGLYSVEFASPKWRSEKVQFRATAGAKVVVPLLAPSPSSQGK